MEYFLIGTLAVLPLAVFGFVLAWKDKQIVRLGSLLRRAEEDRKISWGLYHQYRNLYAERCDEICSVNSKSEFFDDICQLLRRDFGHKGTDEQCRDEIIFLLNSMKISRKMDEIEAGNI